MRLSARLLLVAASFIAALAVSPAEAARRARPGAYDGVWTVQFSTRAGQCNPSYSAPFEVRGRRVFSAGGGKVRGGVGRGGAVSVTISVGASRASGGGRLAGNAGSGSWKGVISGERCAGVWQATRG